MRGTKANVLGRRLIRKNTHRRPAVALQAAPSCTVPSHVVVVTCKKRDSSAIILTLVESDSTRTVLQWLKARLYLLFNETPGSSDPNAVVLDLFTFVPL
jgi:hypothetical protein